MMQSIFFLLMLFGLPSMSFAARTISQLTALQDLILIEQKEILVNFGMSSPSSESHIRVYDDQVPIVFKNNTGLDASQIYITFQGLNAASPTVQQFLTFDSTGKGSFVPSATNLLSANYSIPLSNVPQVKGFPGSYVFYVPLTISGRVYASFNKPLFLPVDATTGGVLDPNVTKYTDPNYYTIYDKWEFTFQNSGQTGATQLKWAGNLNTSGVDFFSISSAISFRSYPSGSLLETLDPTQVNDGPTSFSQNRDTLITTFVTGLTTANNSASWSKLALGFLSDPYVNGMPVSYLRILNPGFSINFPPSSHAGGVTFYQNPTAGFPNDYLKNAAYGENYIATWFGYYNNMATPALTINQDVLASPITYSGNSSGTTPNQSFSLTASGQPTETLAETAVTTTPFFTGASLPLMPANTVLSEYVGGAFEVGLFNYTTVPTISQANLRANAGTYYNNPAFTTTPGPWYDLYAKLLHNEGLIPSYSTTNIGAVYASPYDDLLGINSSIAVKNPTDVVLTPSPYVDIVLNGGNGTLPAIDDSGSYTVTFNFSVGGSTLKYRQGGTGPYIDLTNGQMVVINSFPLQVEYVSGNYPGVSRFYTIYLLYQNMQPTVVSGNLYNGDDQGILGTTTIYPNSATPTAFSISFVQ